MSGRETHDDFERELTAGLERLAPQPRRDTADRTMRAVAETPQRSGWSLGLSHFGALIEWPRVVAVGAVAMVALVVGIAIGTSGLLPSAVGPTPTPQPTAQPSATPIAITWVEPADYQFVLQSNCGLHSVVGTFAITVENHQVSGFRTIEVRPNQREVPMEAMPTLGELMRLAEGYQEAGEAEVALERDPSDGHPTSIRFTWPNHSTKNECYEISEYQVSVGPSAEPTPELADTFSEWTRMDLPDPAPDVYGGAPPQGIVAFDGGYIAVGTINVNCCAGGDPSELVGVVWRASSPDSWSQDVLRFEHASFHHIVQFHRQLLIVGTYAEPGSDPTRAGPPALWRSTDGVNWDRIDGDLPSLVTVGPEGFVGVRLDPGPDGGLESTFVSSSDGASWEEISDRLPTEIRDIAVRSDGTIVGVASVEAPPWSDGSADWNVVSYMRTPEGEWLTADPALEHAQFYSLAAARGQFYATGYRSEQVGTGSFSRVEGTALLWSAPLAFGWTPVDWTGDTPELQRIFDMGAGLVAIGDHIWISTDEATWKRVPDQASLEGVEWMADMIQVYNGLLAVGSVWDGPTSHAVPVAWVSKR